MHILLVRKLIEAGVIRHDTELKATYKGIDIAGRPVARSEGTFFVRNVKINEARQMAFFDTISTIDGSSRQIMADDILTIDGMPLDRLVGIYGFDTMGGKINQGKRRGRRPRNRVAEAT